MNAIIREVEKEMLKETQDFRVGDSVRISMEIVEGDKKRVQIYEGLIIAKKGTGVNASITVRKTTAGIGIEKIIPIHMPSIKAIEVVRRGKIRRAKLYYLRDLTGKATRVKENLELQKSDRAAAATA